jgi:NitT/TauT family transport system ATP-binding protein
MSIQVEQGSQAGAADGQDQGAPAVLDEQDHPARAAEVDPPAGERTREGVRLSGVSHWYGEEPRDRVLALAGVTVCVAPGEVVAVVGPSGCGKSTLLELVCGLQDPREGTVSCAAAALMPQRDLLFPWLSALDNAALALRLAGDSRRSARARADALFGELGLAGFQGLRPQQLSGGMRQRVSFLRTLLSGKPVLCLDEPFGALDAITRLQMQAWLARALARAPRTVVLVTHDVEEAVALADRVVVLSPRPGRIVEELAVALERPRERTDPRLLELRARALRALGLVGSGGNR